MTANYRVRQPHTANLARRKNVRLSNKFLDVYHFPRLSDTQARKLKHGDVVYRIVVTHLGVEVEEIRILSRVKPIYAWRRKSKHVDKEVRDRVNTIYHLHARDKGAESGQEEQICPMSDREKWLLAKTEKYTPIDSPRLIACSTGYWLVSYEDLKARGLALFMGHPPTKDKISIDHRPTERQLSTSEKDYLNWRDAWDQDTNLPWRSTRIWYLSSLTSVYLTTSKQHALRLAVNFLTAKYSLPILLDCIEDDSRYSKLDSMQKFPYSKVRHPLNVIV